MNNLLHLPMPESAYGVHWFWITVWVVAVLFLVAMLFLLTISRWGRSQPLRICVVLSLLGHLLLAGYAATVRIAAANTMNLDGPIEISVGEELTKLDEQQMSEPWEQFPTTPKQLHEPKPLERPRTQPDDPRPPDNQPMAARVQSLPNVAAPQVAFAAAQSPRSAETIEVPEARREEPDTDSAPDVVGSPSRVNPDDLVDDAARHTVDPRQQRTNVPALPDNVTELPSQQQPVARPAPPSVAPAMTQLDPPTTDQTADSDARPQESTGTGDTGGDAPTAAQRNVPDPYRLRFSPSRARAARQLGGSPKAEAAVRDGLRWLAAAQTGDGHWDASDWGAGQQQVAVAGQDRNLAGAGADTGITGLALLAFLGAGHTHLDKGPYQKNVRNALQFLLNQQTRNGNLAGDANMFAAMYCHGIATFALSEAFAITKDERLQSSVLCAVNFTLAAQHPTTGGWRYRPGDTGDTSQLGWQVMAIKSAELAGINIPAQTRKGVETFLSRVSSGDFRGLASYRPGQRASHAMTAEALVCRQFMGMPTSHRTAREAAQFIMQRLPGQDIELGQRPNLYYYYYATLALHQRQDEMWTRWNEALQDLLVENQIRDGRLAGSWDPKTVWGSYGGRVYSTALATLCLEVYYRYLPLYADGTPPKR